MISIIIIIFSVLVLIAVFLRKVHVAVCCSVLQCVAVCCSVYVWLCADRCLSQRSSTVATSYSLLHLEYHPISPSNLNHTGLFLMKRGKRDLENSGEGPRGSVLMDINNLEIESLCTKLSLGIKLVD